MKMGHSHDHSHGHSHDLSHEKSGRALRWALVLTSLYMVVEWVAGWKANSLALLSDAAHMLTDVGALLIGLFAHWLSKQKSPKKLSFGFQRAEIMGALINGLVIWVLAGVLIYEAITRLQDPPAVQGKFVFIVSVIGFFINFFSMKILHGARKESLNVRAAYLHTLYDMVGSLGAITSGLLIWLTDWRLIDPIMTFLVAGLVLLSSWRLLVDSISVLMESTPKNIDSSSVLNSLEKIPTVEGVHDLHIWEVATGKPSLSVHLIARDSAQVLDDAHKMLHSKFKIHHTTIQIEHPEHFSSKCCFNCH